MKIESGRTRRIFLILLAVSVIFLLVYQTAVDEEVHMHEESLPALSFPLKNIMDDEATLNVSANRQVFLIETHMENERVLSKPRQACTVESAGKTLLFISYRFLHLLLHFNNKKMQQKIRVK